MKNIFKKTGLILTGLLFLVIAGCGTETGDNGATSDSQELLVWDWTGPHEADNAEPVNTVIETFEEENPDLNLSIETILNSEMETQLLTAASADNLPDAALIDRASIPRFLEAGMLADLTDYAEEWGNLNDYPEAIIDSVSNENGDVYGIPADGDVRTLLYRTDVFEAAGLDPNDPPETWSEIVEYSQAIQDVSDETGVEWGFALNGGDSEHTSSRTLPWIWDLGGDFVDENGNPALNSAPVIETVNFMDDLVNEYEVSPPESYLNTKQEVASLINSGNAAMAVVGSWEWTSDSNYLLQEDLQDNLASAPIPLPDDAVVNEPYTTAGGGAWVIFENSEAKDEAWDWIEARSSNEYLVDNFENGTGNLPLRESAYENEIFSSNPIFESFTEAVPNSRSKPAVTNYAELSSAYRVAVQSVLSGESSSEDALDEAQNSVE